MTASGVVRCGDSVLALPSGKSSRVKSIVTYEGEQEYAFAPQSITITLEDEIDISRGEMLVHLNDVPISSTSIDTMLVWMDEEPMDSKKRYFIKQTTNTTRATVDRIKYKVNINTMDKLTLGQGIDTEKDMTFQLNQIGRVELTTARELFFDPYTQNKETGAFILIDPITHNTCAVGMIIGEGDKNEVIDSTLTVNLTELDINEEHHNAIEKVIEYLRGNGLDITLIK